MGKFNSIRMGKAFVEIDTDRSKFEKGLNAAEARLRSFSQFATKAGGILAGAGGALAAGFIPAIKAASDMEETMNKFNVVFGESKDRVKEWSDNFAGEIGRSKKQIADFMASSQDLFVPLGFEVGAAEEMSKQLTGLSIDLASFNNMQDADVLRDLHAALTGSGEVMKKYGVIVSEAAVKQELLNQGLDPKTADNAAKVQARLNIILRGTTAAQGDAARSAGSFANQMKALKASSEDTKVAIGQALLPVVTPLVGKVREGAQIFQKWAEENPKLIKTLAMVAAGAVAVGGALMTLGAASNMLAAGLAAVNTMSGMTAGSLKALKTVAIAAAFAVAARAAFRASSSVRTLNRELEKTGKLTNRLNQMDANKVNRTLSKAGSIEDPEARKAFLQAELEKAQTASASNAGGIRSAQKRLDATQSKTVNKAVNAVYGSAEIDAAKSDVADALSRYDSAKATEQAIQNALTDLQTQQNQPQAAEPARPDIDPKAFGESMQKALGGLDGASGSSFFDTIRDKVAELPNMLDGMVERLKPSVDAAQSTMVKTDEKIQKRESLNVGLSEQQTEFLKGQTQRSLAEMAFKDTAKNTGRAAQLLEEIAGRDGITVSSNKEGF